MGFIHFLWKKISNTNAIKTASGLSTSDLSAAYTIYSTTIKCLLILLVGCEIWNFFSVEWTMDAITEAVNVILIQLGALFKYRVLVVHKDIFKSLASAMLSKNFDISTRDRKYIVEIWRRRNQAMLNLLLGLGTCTVIAWHIYPLVDNLDYNLMVSIRLPFNYQTPRLYSITYICTLIVFSYVSYNVMANDLILQVFLTHLLCQFEVLNDCFKNILVDCQADFPDITTDKLYLNKEFTRTYKKRLGALVEHHIFIINNTVKLNNLMSTPMLIHLAMSTMLICFIGFQLTTSVDVNVTKGLMSLFYLGYNMFVLYVICRLCEEIKVQSEKTGEAVYFSGWENGIITVPGVRTSIFLILVRANKPIALSAGGMYELSLKSYAAMVKTSYTLLTVLLRFR